MGRRKLGHGESREEAVDRFVRLRPAVLARMRASVPADLRAEFGTITLHQLQALVRLEPGGLTMHELACALGASGAACTSLADRLIAQGLAVRDTDPGDRRVVRLTLNEAGRTMAERFTRAERQMVAGLLDRLSDQQVADYLDIMETLAADSEPAEPGPASSDAPLSGPEMAAVGR